MVTKFEVRADDLEGDPNQGGLVDDGEGGLEEDLCAQNPALDGASALATGGEVTAAAAAAATTAAAAQEGDEEEEEDLC